jgi:opacity protein-like surface antigen
MGRKGRSGAKPDGKPECAMTTINIYKQIFVAVISTVSAIALMPVADAQERAGVASPAGFYGGVSLRDRGTESMGLNVGAATSSWTRFAAPAVDESPSRALVFGGYRWRNDIAVEALFSSADKYALRPVESPVVHGGVGLGIGNTTLGLTDVQSRNWNLDVFTSWSFYKSFALYGRLGYGPTDATSGMIGPSISNGVDPRRGRDGVNYGVGLRYDMNSDLGLRLEYARFGRFGLDLSSTLPESDHVTFGVQYRF